MTEKLRLILKKLNILYVEDNKNFLVEVNNVFRSMFNTVYTAFDGFEALEVLDKYKIDIILTDLNMPNKDGIQFIKEVRESNKNISIIILTAHADKDLLLEATNLQIDGYLTKPINFTKITNALTNAVERANFTSEYILQDNSIYDMNSKSILQNGVSKELGKKESQLLEFLILNSNKITTKDEIIYHIWDIENVTESALKNLISNLRAKTGKENIINYPGHGWKISLKN